METKIYLTIIIFLLSVLTFIAIDSKKRNINSLKAGLNIVELTKIVEPSLSVNPLEDRFLYLQKSINRVYPNLPKPNKLGYIYVK